MSYGKFNNHLQKNRLLAFSEQKGHCYYCDAPMWLGNSEGFAVYHGIKESQVKRFQCTAEHLVAQQDGGTDERKNIVAACSFCNSRRHRALKALSPEKYRKRVVHRLRSQKWHPREFHHML